jgi:hypothetical protein
LFIGKRTHDALEQFYRHRQLGVHLSNEQITARINETWGQAVADEGIQFSSTDEEKKLNDQTIRLVDAYLRQVPDDEPQPLAVETSLESALVDPVTGEELMPLLGIVDLVVPSNEGPVICDFKTAASSTTPTEMQHEIQLSCYAFLFRQMTGQKEAGLEIRSLVKTKTPQIGVHRFGPRGNRHFRRLFAVVKSYVEDLERERFLMRPGWTCGSCDFRERCAEWGG